MSIKFTASIQKEGKFYVAHAVEFGVVSQGKTIESAKKNLQEAVELYLEVQPKSIRKFHGGKPLVTVLEATV
jgi:predicted RNase H-like HicB family nuclease